MFIAVSESSPYMVYSRNGTSFSTMPTPATGQWLGVASFPDTDNQVDTNSKIARFKAIDMPPGEYRATMKAQQVMVWKMYYRKAWLGI